MGIPNKPKCCISKSNDNGGDISGALKYKVDLYLDNSNVFEFNGEQKIQYQSLSPFITKQCHVIDRSIGTQEIVIIQNTQQPNALKEFIFDNFDTTNFNISRIVWSGINFKFENMNKIASASINGKKFYCDDGKPFISIIAGIMDFDI